MTSSLLIDHFLIAMPSLEDPQFEKTVTYICAHSDEGAMGITINRPLDIKLGDVLNQMDLVSSDLAIENQQIFLGGPVQTDRGFVLHNSENHWDSSLKVSDDMDMTTSRDVLNSIANGDGPNECLVALGYSGWSAGQLEDELLNNSWLSVPADLDIMFRHPVEKRWELAVQSLGIDPYSLSNEIGHA